jgi:hypothetical protein
MLFLSSHSEDEQSCAFVPIAYIYHDTKFVIQIRKQELVSYRMASENTALSIFPYRGRYLPLQGNRCAPIGGNTRRWSLGELNASL